jgi:hypothetical protein
MIITHNLRYTLAHHGIRACLRGRNPIDNANHAARNMTHLCEASTLKPVLLRHTQELGGGGHKKVCWKYVDHWTRNNHCGAGEVAGSGNRASQPEHAAAAAAVRAGGGVQVNIHHRSAFIRKCTGEFLPQRHDLILYPLIVESHTLRILFVRIPVGEPVRLTVRKRFSLRRGAAHSGKGVRLRRLCGRDARSCEHPSCVRLHVPARSFHLGTTKSPTQRRHEHH